jgi:IS30 family transposase
MREMWACKLIPSRYFPKKTDLSAYSQADLDKVALRLNQRPGKLWTLKLPQVNSKPVLHRTIETAPFCRNFE